MKKTTILINVNGNNVQIDELFATYKIEVIFNNRYTIRINKCDILDALDNMKDEVSFSNFVNEYNAKLEANIKRRQAINDGTLPF